MKQPDIPAQNPPVQPFGIIAKALHWGFVLLFIYGVVRQVDNVAQLEDGIRLQFEFLFALMFLFFLVIRFLYMQWTGATALPADANPVQKIAAKAVHYAMYASLALIAISGILIGLLFLLGVKTGFLMAAAIGFHEFSISASYALIALHIAAAVYHRFRKDGIWDAMVPFWKER